MSILAFGGEMGFLIPSEANGVETGSGTHYDSAFARCQARDSGESNYLETPTVSTTADFWLRFDIVQSGATNSATQKQTAVMLDSGGIERVRLTVNWESSGAASTWQMEKWSGTAWVGVGSCAASASARQTIDIHVVSNTASGSIKMYMSGTLRIDSGSTDLSSFSGIAKVRAYGMTRGISATVDYSQIVLASEPTIGFRVGTVAMTGQGSTHTFDTGGFANIDEIVYSDADFIQSGTANQVELFTGTPVNSFTGYTIRAIAVTARAKTSGAAPTKMELALRSAGTTYFSADKTLDAGYGAFCNVWETNPATSAAFLSSEIAALEYGVKSIT